MKQLNLLDGAIADRAAGNAYLARLREILASYKP